MNEKKGRRGKTEQFHSSSPVHKHTDMPYNDTACGNQKGKNEDDLKI